MVEREKEWGTQSEWLGKRVIVVGRMEEKNGLEREGNEKTDLEKEGNKKRAVWKKKGTRKERFGKRGGK